MVSTGKSSGYLIDAPKWPKVSRIHLTRTFRAEVHQESGQGLQNALTYRANGNCVKRICELPVNNLDSQSQLRTVLIENSSPKHPIQTTILDCFSYVLGFNGFSALKIGYRSGHFKNAVVRARCKSLLSHRPFQ